MPMCPSHPATALKPEKKGWYCEECGENVFSYDQLPRLSEGGNAAPTPPKWPGALDPATLSTWLAHPWAALCTERHPRVRLHWLVDTAELVVRWTAAVALAEVVHAHAGTLPATVTDAIAEHVESPTLGRWLLILRALGGVAPEAPLLTPTLFPWARETLAPCFTAQERGGSVETSLLELRNHVAHGGGIGQERARLLVDAHLPTLVALLAGARDTLGGAILVADGVQLVGTRPAPTATQVPGPGPWLVGEAGVLPLEPLVHYGPVLRVGPDGALHPQAGGSAPQVYTRGSRDRLRYTTLGTDASHSDRFDVHAFRALFQLDRARGTRARDPNAVGGFVWDDFVQEARTQAEQLIGRTHELAQAKAWLKARDPRGPAPRVGWISAGPGVGKSILMARLVADYSNKKDQDKGVYYHRFRGGDGRNDRRSFLRLLQASLLAWAPLAAVTAPPAEDADDGKKLEEDVRARLDAIAGLRASNPRSMPPAFWVFVDGLDEAAGADQGLPELLRKLAPPGTVWLVAGRPEHGLDLAFATPDCEAVFAGGLPLMHAGDIRAMLMAGLDGGRFALLERDVDVGEDVTNPFVDEVAARAQGLPLYVHLLLEDLGAGHLDVRSEARLPDGLNAYYDAILERIGTSDAKHYLTKIVALLARAEDPLDAPGLALLLARGRPEHINRYLAAVDAALRAGAMLLRRAPGPDTSDGWALYHQSFRDYVGRTNTLATSVWEAEQSLVDAAADWGAQTSPDLLAIRNHLFRWGTAYCLRWGGASGRESACARLTDFAYLQARTAALPASTCTALAREYSQVLAKLNGDVRFAAFSVWTGFMRERVHLLRRGDAAWPTNRILLQVAVEHADESPVTKAAEAWLEGGGCDWVWMRNVERNAAARPYAVLEGHPDEDVGGALPLAAGRVLVWCLSGDVSVWAEADGVSALVHRNNLPGVSGVVGLQSSSGRLLLWGDAGVLEIWSAALERVARLEGHRETVLGAVELSGGRLVSWSSSEICIFVQSTGELVHRLTDGLGEIAGVVSLGAGRVLSWSRQGTVCLWATDTGSLLKRKHARAGLEGAMALTGQRVLLWKNNGRLQTWSVAEGLSIERAFVAHDAAVGGALELRDGRILSWSFDATLRVCDATLRVWDGATGRLLCTLKGHEHFVGGALELSSGRILSWSADETLRIWDATDGRSILFFDKHEEEINGAIELPGGDIVSWADESIVRRWDSVTGRQVDARVMSGWVQEVVLMSSGRLLGWGAGCSACVIDLPGEPDGRGLHATDKAIRVVCTLGDGRLVMLRGNRRVEVVHEETGEVLAKRTVPFPSDSLVCVAGDGVWVSGGVKLISYRWDGSTLRADDRAISGVWVSPLGGALVAVCEESESIIVDSDTGYAVRTLRGRSASPAGARLLEDGRLLTWDRVGGFCLHNKAGRSSGIIHRGHTLMVRGVLELEGGRLLSWAFDETIRVWKDGVEQEKLTLSDSHGVSQVVVLDALRMLVSFGDRSLHVVDRATGRTLSQVPLSDVCNLDRELRHAWLSSTAPAAVVGSALGGGGQGHAFLVFEGPHAAAVVQWYALGDWSAQSLSASGLFVARGDPNAACLHLYHGNRRVTVEEAAAILDASGSANPRPDA